MKPVGMCAFSASAAPFSEEIVEVAAIPMMAAPALDYRHSKRRASKSRRGGDWGVGADHGARPAYSCRAILGIDDIDAAFRRPSYVIGGGEGTG